MDIRNQIGAKTPGGAGATAAKAPADRSGSGVPGGPRMARPLVPGIPARSVDASGVVRTQEGAAPATQAPAEEAAASEPTVAQRSGGDGQLVVGREIHLKGDIKACDTLVVYGFVEATLPGRAVIIGESGRYRGAAEVEEAEIAGDFDGELRVRGRLTIASSGRVRGTIRYGELSIATGGRVSGDIKEIGEEKEAGQAASGASAGGQNAGGGNNATAARSATDATKPGAAVQGGSANGSAAGDQEEKRIAGQRA